MDSDGGLVLNIFTGQDHTVVKRNQKLPGARGERIKARRHEKFERQQQEIPVKQDASNVTEADKTENISSSPHKRKKSPNGQTSDNKRVKVASNHNQIISSLFKNNPQIPSVPSEKVEKLKEAVFSSDTFAELDIHQFMVSNLQDKMGLVKLTSVQKQSIPKILDGRDVLVKSQTGSGKTLAYAVPIVHKLQAHEPRVQRSDGPYVIVLVPTRELAIQSYETLQKLTRSFTWIVPGCIMGGEQRKKEKSRLRKGINILVSTPGRLLDHMEHTESLVLDHIKWLVIDEADRLLDMGYEKDVRKMISFLDEKQTGARQTILLSATLNQGVEQLAGMVLNDPLSVDISHQESSNTNTSKLMSDSFAVPEKLRQHFVVVPSKLRLVTLSAFILWKCKYDSKQGKLIVFFATQDSVDLHFTLFDSAFGGEEEDDRHIVFYRLHGDMQQKDRTKTFQDFAQSSNSVLLCTDVAARGLDLPKVQWIVQYNSPGSTADYVHRVGRTARIGSQGNSLLFLGPSEVSYVKELAQNKISVQELDMNDILKTLLLEADTLTMSDGKQRPHTAEECATAVQMRLENYIYNNQVVLQSARKAYQSFLRAYATYPSELKYIFHVKNLHLGHVAKSFGLREAPSRVGHFREVSQKRMDKKDDKMRKKEKRGSARVDISEFGSGLEGATKTVFKKDVKRKKLKKMTS